MSTSFDKSIPYKTQKGSEYIYFEDYLYVFWNTISGGSNLLRCKDKKCSGRAKINSVGQVTVTKHHSCGGDCFVPRNKYILLQAKQQYLEAATKAPRSACHSIYLDFYRSLLDPLLTSADFVAQQCVAHFPTENKMYDVMRKRRKIEYGALPATLSALEIPDHYTKTRQNHRFLFYRFSENETDINKQIIVFSTLSFFEKLCMCERIAADGTFKTVPEIYQRMFKRHSAQVNVFIFILFIYLHLYYKVLTLHTFINGKSFCLLYALLPTKSKETYLELLRIIFTQVFIQYYLIAICN